MGKSSGKCWLKTFGAGLPKIHSMGVLLFDPIWGRQDHVDARAELLHVIRGRVTLVAGARRCEAGPGDFLVVPPGTRHRDEFDPAQGLEVFMVFWRWSRQRQFFARIDNRLLQTMPEARKAELGRLLDGMRTECSAGTEADEMVARARLGTALMLMLRAADEGRRQAGRRAGPDYGARRRRALFEQAKQYLQEHLRECIALDEVARALRVSPYYLSHVFSREAGFSLFGYLTALRMKKAQGLLGNGRLTVKEVAGTVGYPDPNYFAKVFRRHFGRAPRDLSG